MTTIWGWTDHRPWQSHGDVGFVIRHGDMDDGDDDDTDDDDNTDDDTDDDKDIVEKKVRVNKKTQLKS